jgi:hypothetical protein
MTLSVICVVRRVRYILHRGNERLDHIAGAFLFNDIEIARRQVIERLPIWRTGTPTDIGKGRRLSRLGRCRFHDRRRPRPRRRHHRAIRGTGRSSH